MTGMISNEEIIAAIGATYLKGRISQVGINGKFSIMDNLDDSPSGADGTAVHGGVRLRLPLKLSMTVCVFCKEGRLSTRIQQKDYLLEPGGVLVIIAGQILEQVVLLEESKVILVAIDSDYIMTEILGPHGRSLRRWLLHNQNPTIVSIPPDEAANYEKLCESLKFIVRNSDHDTADGVLSGFTYIFASLLLKWRSSMPVSAGCSVAVHDASSGISGNSREEPANCSRERAVLVRFQNDIHNFSRKDRTVGFYARRQFVSEKHFSRLVKKASGRKPLDLIREYVVLDAKSLLLSGKYSIKEVAETLGFQNHSFFTRFFRLSTGKTPGEFMREE